MSGDQDLFGEVEQLYPCPFCGCDEVMLDGSPCSAFVECQGCGAQGPYYSYDSHAALKAWNKRFSGEGESN